MGAITKVVECDHKQLRDKEVKDNSGVITLLSKPQALKASSQGRAI